MKRSNINSSSASHRSIPKGKSVSCIQNSSHYNQTNTNKSHNNNNTHNNNKSVHNNNNNKSNSKMKQKITKSMTQNSLIKIHQPLSLENRNYMKDDKGNNRNNNNMNSNISNMNNINNMNINNNNNMNKYNQKLSSVNNSRKNQQQSRNKIHQHLQSKRSYLNPTTINSQHITTTTNPSKNHQNINSNPITSSKPSTVKQQNKRLLQQNKQLKQKYLRIQQTAIEDKEKIKTLISRISQMKRNNVNGNNVNGLENSYNVNSNTMMMVKNKTTASYAQIIKQRSKNNTQRDNCVNINNINNPIQTPFRALFPLTSNTKSPFQNSQVLLSSNYNMSINNNNNKSKSRHQQHQNFTCPNKLCQQHKKHLQSQLYKQRIRRDQLQQQKQEWEKNKNVLKRQYEDLLNQIHSLRENNVEDNNYDVEIV